jgi:hypothetical protein
MDRVSPRAAALIAFGVALAFSLAPVPLGAAAIVARIPDDAFYYFVLAKNFATQGTWTFDGVNAATGFHLLFGYALAGLYRIAPEIGFVETYLLVVLVNAALMAAAVYWLAHAARETFGGGGLGVLLVAMSAGGLHLVGFPMESCLVIAAAALSYRLVAAEAPGPGVVLAALATGIVGVLARSDYALLPFALLGGFLLHRAWHRRWTVRGLGVPAMLCLGALLGIGLVTLHTYHFTGGFVQRSASIKHFWATVSGYTPWPGLARVIELFEPYGLPRVAVPVVLAGLGLWVIRRGRLRALLDHPLSLGSVLAIVGYGAVYALNGAVQYWYAATFFAAVALLAAGLVAALPVRGRVVPLLVLLYAAGAVWRFANPPWPWQVATMEAGEMLRDAPDLAPVAAWNAGIVAYFAARPVTNLDGLVNDAVYPAVVSGGLAPYLAAQGIRYIVDFPTMLSEEAGRRGGYADGTLRRCARLERTIDPARTFDGTPLTLYRLEPACVASAPRREATAP